MRNFRTFRTPGWLALALLWLGAAAWAAEALPAGAAPRSWQAVTGLVTRVYGEVLHRVPDADGLKMHAQLLVQSGHDEAWLRAALRNSNEGRGQRAHLRAQRTYLTLLVCALAGLLYIGYRALSQVRERFPAHYAYLQEPARLAPLSVLLLALFVFENLKATGPDSLILTAVLLVAGLHLLRLPRWLTYGVSLAGLIGLFSFYVFVDAQGPQDAFSDRNEAVEIAARAALHGENPWSSRSVLGLPITTGPSSILTAIPFVKVTGRINTLTFGYWLLFLGLLLAGDLLRRNASFVLLGLLLLSPWTGFLHTLHWSLDELYYAAILLPVLWLLLGRRWLVWAGVLMGFMLFSRLVYAYGLAGVGLWWLGQHRDNWKALWRIAAGAGLYLVATLLIFYLIGGHAFLTANFWKNSQMTGLVSDANWLAASLSWLRNLTQPPLAYLLVCLLLVPASLLLRRVRHPFYHFALGEFLACTVAFAPPAPADYALLFVIPLCYALAFRETPAAPA